MMTFEGLAAMLNEGREVHDAPGHDLTFNRLALEGIPAGLVMEFGVGEGRHLRNIADAVSPRKVYGFDSFFGLPEDWLGNNPKGKFSTEGQPPPNLPGNCDIVAGLFHESLPGFLDKHRESVAFVHVDCDLYSSTKTVLEMLSHRFRTGSILSFNEFWNYPEQHEHEAKAFLEFLNTCGFSAKCVLRTRTEFSQAAFCLKEE